MGRNLPPLFHSIQWEDSRIAMYAFCTFEEVAHSYRLCAVSPANHISYVQFFIHCMSLNLYCICVPYLIFNIFSVIILIIGTLTHNRFTPSPLFFKKDV